MGSAKVMTLIVPCYNEEFRLDLVAFAEGADDLRIVFVDDGSKDQTVSKIQNFIKDKPNFDLLILPRNGGKGEAVRQGMLYALSHPQWKSADWIGYWDADLATPLWEVANMLSYGEFYGQEVESIWGSRVYRLGSRIRRSAKRHYLGRGFATLIAVLLKVESYDSQCGAKIFRRGCIEKAFREKFLSPWIFDVEILLRLGQEKILEYPLRQWTDVPGSKVLILREIFRVPWDILRIRKHYLNAARR